MTANAKSVDVFQMITNRIIDKLEQGVVPWRRPWTSNGIPRNLISKKPYTGINLLLLASMDFTRNYFLTWKQVHELGGKIIEGTTAIPVIFWKWSEVVDDESGETKKVSMIRYYSVFNIDQCQDLPESIQSLGSNGPEFDESKPAEAIIKEMENKPKIVHKQVRAYYAPKDDLINMPPKKKFKDMEGYYATLFHELVHSTGHESRLNRAEIVENTDYGSEMYSKEELVAEIGACFLKSIAGIPEKQFDNNVAYINSWLKALKDDKRMVIFASAQAQKAVNFILNRCVLID